MERRDFLKGFSAAGLLSMMDPAYLTAKEGLQSGQGPTDPVPKRQYGRAEDMISVIGFGGIVVKDVTPKEATLIRRMPDGKDVHVKLDLDRITTGKDPNIKLAAGDILWVPDTIATRVQDWINRNIYFRAGMSANVTYNVSGVEYMNRQAQQSGSNSSNLEDQFDPFGFLNRGSALRTLTAAPTP